MRRVEIPVPLLKDYPGLLEPRVHHRGSDRPHAGRGHTLGGVDEGDFFTACGWEYFTYRYGANGNCGGGGCPSGIVRIVGMAELNDGANHPDCFDNSGNGETQLALLNFLVANNYTLECQYLPIRFIWYDCGDNALSSVTGDTLLLSRNVYDYVGSGGMDTYVLLDEEPVFPGYYGAMDECFYGSGFPDKPLPIPHVDFYNGGVDVICSDSIDAPGDINLNGIAYEIADAVMFTNYFIEGLGAFGDHVDGSIAASDVNKDGIALTVSDLVYLVRVVVGDALPYPTEVAIQGSYTHANGTVAINDANVAAVHLVVEGDVHPSLQISDANMNYRFDGQNTSIIVTPDLEVTPMATFTGAFLSNVDGEVLAMDAADYDGTQVMLKNIPTEFALSQNYPNPFNPTTTLAFALPVASDYTIHIFNVTGQIVETFSGHADAGQISVEWDAANLASGVYFYRLQASEFSAVKKAILLK